MPDQTEPRPFPTPDPVVFEAALRRFIANEVDYDFHKNFERGEDDGLDHYSELTEAFIDILIDAAVAHGYARPGAEAPKPLLSESDVVALDAAAEAEFAQDTEGQR